MLLRGAFFIARKEEFMSETSDEFKIGLSVDISNVKTQIENMKQLPTLKLDIDSKDLKTKIQKAIEDAYKNVKIVKLPSPKTPTTERGNPVAQYQKEFQQLSKIAKRIGSLQFKISGLDTAKNRSELNVLRQQLNQFKKDYSSLLSSIGGNLSVEQWGQLQSVIDDTDNKVANLKSKLSDGIKFKLDVGDYQTQIDSIQSKYQKWGLSAEEAKLKISDLESVYQKMHSAKSQDKRIQYEQEYQKTLQKTKNDLEKISFDVASPVKVDKLSDDIQVWMQKNTVISKSAKLELQNYLATLSNTDGVANPILENIEKGFKKIQIAERQAGRLGKSFTETIQAGAKKFADWAISSGAVVQAFSKFRQAISELKEVDTLLTEISKANESLSSSELKAIGGNSFSIASKYGKKATDYLSGVQEMSRAGYKNAEGMAELSTAAQGAGDMTADLANQYIVATDKAYKLNGSVEKLTTTLDGVNYITNNNAVNMTELADAMSVVGSTAASFGVEANEATAAVGTMIATTQQSGSEAARAFRAILLNIRQVSDEEEGIDAEGLTKYEEACNALNVKLKETKNGVQALRDPMEVLKELSIEYNKLDENDVRRTNLLSSLGGKLRSTQLDALLRQWNMYEKMLQEYSDGGGSMAREAEKTANSWEGSLNRLSNTWTSTVDNFANSDGIIIGINTLNGLLSVVDKLTSGLFALPTVAAIAYAALSAKGRGGFEEQSLHRCSAINYSPFLATVKFSSDVYEFCAVA